MSASLMKKLRASQQAAKAAAPALVWPKRDERPFEEVYDLGAELGRGAYASVFRCTLKSSGEEFAVKVIDRSSVSTRQLNEVHNEVSILASLHNPHISQLVGLHESLHHFSVVMELITGCDVLEKIVEIEHYSEADAQGAIRCLLEATAYLHSNNILHLDIKPENLVLRGASLTNCALIDFGCAVRLGADVRANSYKGTPNYMAPEVVRCRHVNESYTTAADDWSSGVVLFVLLSGTFPFYHDNENLLLDAIEEGSWTFEAPVWKSVVSDDAKDFISALLMPDASKRLSASDALHHPWMQEKSASRKQLIGVRDEIKSLLARRRLKGAVHAVKAGLRLSLSGMPPTASRSSTGGGGSGAALTVAGGTGSGTIATSDASSPSSAPSSSMGSPVVRELGPVGVLDKTPGAGPVITLSATASCRTLDASSSAAGQASSSASEAPSRYQPMPPAASYPAPPVSDPSSEPQVPIMMCLPPEAREPGSHGTSRSTMPSPQPPCGPSPSDPSSTSHYHAMPSITTAAPPSESRVATNANVAASGGTTTAGGGNEPENAAGPQGRAGSLGVAPSPASSSGARRSSRSPSPHRQQAVYPIRGSADLTDAAGRASGSGKRRSSGYASQDNRGAAATAQAATETATTNGDGTDETTCRRGSGKNGESHEGSSKLQMQRRSRDLRGAEKEVRSGGGRAPASLDSPPSSSPSSSAPTLPESSAPAAASTGCTLPPSAELIYDAIPAPSPVYMSSDGTARTFSYEELRRDQHDAEELEKMGLDTKKLECYLRPEDFAAVIKVSADEFKKLPQWKKTILKKQNHLF